MTMNTALLPGWVHSAANGDGLVCMRGRGGSGVRREREREASGEVYVGVSLRCHRAVYADPLERVDGDKNIPDISTGFQENAGRMLGG